jgi:ATP-binding cassette subfamily G (WHITE) protein 1
MLFAVYGMGAGTSSIPIYMRVLMCLSYLRFGFEGLMYAVYGNDRSMMPCPPEEIYCHFRSPKTLLLETGMENSNIWVAVLALTAYMILFKVMSYFLLRWRLSRHREFAALNYVGRIIKTHFNFTQQYKWWIYVSLGGSRILDLSVCFKQSNCNSTEIISLSLLNFRFLRQWLWRVQCPVL